MTELNNNGNLSMKKKHSLPDISFGNIQKEQISVEELLGVNEKKFRERLEEYFDNNFGLVELFDSETGEYNDKMNDASLKTMVDLYNTFDDREILYALWSFINANLKMHGLDIIMDPK